MIISPHKAFISFHHFNDESSKILFEKIFSDYTKAFISTSVNDGDINPALPTDTIRNKIRDEYLQDSTVTIVLIGSETWKRKHVDWEISSSIRRTKNSSRSGLLGIILPSYPRQDTSKYNPYTIPPRLYDNIKCGYAKIYNWTTNARSISQWIHEAFLRRDSIDPDLSYPMFFNNKSGNQWNY